MQKTAQKGLIILFSLTILFHMFILLQVIPYQNVWGGRLQSLKEMYRFEFFSIGLNLCFLMIILVKAGILKSKIPARMLTLTLWVMCIFFLLNTIGNALSSSRFESWIFTPLTCFISLFCLVLARSKPES